MQPRLCSNCEHGQTFDVTKTGIRRLRCRRYPPTPIMIGSMLRLVDAGHAPYALPITMRSAYPEVGETDTCGEWRISRADLDIDL